MLRSKLKEEDKWDLTKYFKDDKEYERMYDETLNLLEDIVSRKGTIMRSANDLYEFLVLDDKLSINLEKIYVYSYLYHYSDTTDEKGKILKDKADKLDEKITSDTSFIRSEMLSVKYDYVLKLIEEDERLKFYAFSLEKLFRYEKHTLSEAEEKIISLASNAMGGTHNCFSALDNADAKFGFVKVNGKDVELTHSNYIKLVSDKDREVRKSVFLKYYEFFKNHYNTISEMYKGKVKEDLFMSTVRNFNSPLEMSLYRDNIDKSVYTNLISTIHDNLKPLHKYMKLRKDYFGFDEMHMYDVYMDMVDGETRKFTFEEARDIVLEAVSPLGNQYVEDLKKAFSNRWIDKYPNDGKRSGAYQWGSYGVDPYVSINFEGTEDSVSTLAHELGHAMHSYYSDKSQEYVYAGYPIFLAEIASTVNEVLLNDYMVKHAESDEEKLLYITSFLDKFRSTVYRQTQFAEFEMIAHDMEQNGEALTPESLGKVYFDINKMYYGDDIVSDDEIKYEWSRVPHFYTPFYVYKYATGFCAALAIANNILSNKEGARLKYLNFLKAGGSKYPLETLKDCGVDMTSKEPIESAINLFEEKLNQACEIVKRVKKDGK